MSYIGNVGDSNTSINSDFSKYTYEYIATAGQTTFTGTDINSAVLGYTVGNIIVSYGGADLAFSDYTATDGTSVVLADGALVGKILRVVAFEAFELADAYTKTQIDANTYTQSQADALLAAKAPLASPSFTGTVTADALTVDGFTALTRDGNKVMTMDRLTSDGEILRFNKDGTTVGSIKSDSGSIMLGSGDVGVYFDAASDRILPTNITTGSVRNDAIDIGGNPHRFKDLYLSGGIKLGGTGAANTLDDYEEGTFTPGGTGIDTSNSVAYYTKVGNICIAQMWIYANGSTDGTITGLPFTAGHTNNAIAAGTIGYINGSVTGLVSAGQNTSISMYNGTGTGTMASGNQMHCAMTYRTT